MLEIEEKITLRLVEKRYVLPGTEILHSDNGPALIRYHANGVVWEEEYHREGVRHCDSGPAWISWSPEGFRQWEAYYQNGEMHRDDGPAYVTYRASDGEVESEDFYRFGKKQPSGHMPKPEGLKEKGVLTKAWDSAAVRKASPRRHRHSQRPPTVR